jgi:hypothetical protein
MDSIIGRARGEINIEALIALMSNFDESAEHQR